MDSNARKTLLVVSQTFAPDPAAVGQHMADVAFELGRRGHRVIVYTSNRGYEDPSIKYPARECRPGVEIRRLPFSSFGKKSLITRALGTFTFTVQCVLVALFTRDLGGIFFSTSPPLIGAAAALAKIVRRVPIAYWAMDLNPDQLIAMGKIGPRSLAARVLEGVNRFILRYTDVVIALDRFMVDRLAARDIDRSKMITVPPWSHDRHMKPPPDPAKNPFRLRHGLTGRFVVMYSGNHSPANPLRTLLEAAVRLRDDDSLRFVFIGGGLGKKEVEQTIREKELKNALSLPYQPLEELGNSLGAADVHIVSLGDNMVGIIHPCKIYGAMAVARPILYLGPRPSHVSDILDEHPVGWHVSHGDVDGCVGAILAAKQSSPQDLERMGAAARRILRNQLAQAMLCDRLCDVLGRLYRRTTARDRAARFSGPTAAERSVTCAR
jgi:colanic acid biosynthesis glycosyl transferase WcaI